MTRPSSLMFYVLVTVIFCTGVLMMIHRYWVYDIPLLPGDARTIWSLEAKVSFVAEGAPVKVSLARPSDQQGFSVVRESGASPGYGLNFLDVDPNRAGTPRAQWTVRSAKGVQELYYHVDLVESAAPVLRHPPPPPIAASVDWPDPYRTAIEALMTDAFQTSADNFSFARELIKRFNQTEAPQNVRLLKRAYQNRLPQLLRDMLNSARVPAAVVYGLELEDGRRRQTLIPMLSVWQDEKRQVFRLTEDTQEEDKPLLLWEQSGAPVLDVMGGYDSGVRFSMLRREESAYGVQEEIMPDDSLFNFSVHSLPVEEQAMFKTIFLLPVGALVVCILRILIGVRTSGTFMPVLIAIAFLQTSLVTGILGFLLVVGTGLAIRSYLSHLNLLLVARISAGIVAVIGIITLLSVISYKTGLTEGLKIIFFPMVILAWTVERMSILWEEEGPREVMIQGGGSLLTAVVAFFAMQSELMRHLTFNFMGIQLVILALVLLLGSYTGYRLSELKRFTAFRKRA